MTQHHNFKCPNCEGCDHINVIVQCWARITDEGTDAGKPYAGSQIFDMTSRAACGRCSHFGKVADFMPDEEADFWTDAPHHRARRDPMNDDHWQRNDDQIAALKDLVEELRSKLPHTEQ